MIEDYDTYRLKNRRGRRFRSYVDRGLKRPGLFTRHSQPPTVYIPSSVVRLDQTPSLTRDQLVALVPWMTENGMIPVPPPPVPSADYYAITGLAPQAVYDALDIPFGCSNFIIPLPGNVEIQTLILKLVFDSADPDRPAGNEEVLPHYAESGVCEMRIQNETGQDWAVLTIPNLSDVTVYDFQCYLDGDEYVLNVERESEDLQRHAEVQVEDPFRGSVFIVRMARTDGYAFVYPCKVYLYGWCLSI